MLPSREQIQREIIRRIRYIDDGSRALRAEAWTGFPWTDEGSRECSTYSVSVMASSSRCLMIASMRLVLTLLFGPNKRAGLAAC